jgi:hypothetical protein
VVMNRPSQSSLESTGVDNTSVTLRVILAVFVGVIGAVSLPCRAATLDQFQQVAQRALDIQRGRDGWNASRCMIGAYVVRDVVTGTNDNVLKYGDKILEVADQPISTSVDDPVIDALRKQPPSGVIKLKVLREGSAMTLSVGCSDSRPVQTLIAGALVSVTEGNYGACVEKISSVESLHKLDVILAALRFQCAKRAGRLTTSEAQALYDLDRQAIIEKAILPGGLEKLRQPLLVDEGALGRMGASDLAAQLKSAFETAQNRGPSAPVNNDGAEGDATAHAVPAANMQPITRDSNHDGTFDFRGLRVGGLVTPAAVERASKDKDMSDVGAVKCGAGSQGAQVCNGIAVVAGAVAYVNAVIDASGRLIRISLAFPSEHFEQVAQGAVEKYGKPTRSSSASLQNRMGATFENTTLIWGDLRGEYIQASKYGDTIDKGYIYFGTAQDTALQKQVQDDSRKKGAF